MYILFYFAGINEISQTKTEKVWLNYTHSIWKVNIKY